MRRRFKRDSKVNNTIEVVNGDINRALRTLKKKMQNGGILNDLRKKEFYQSRGTKVRLQKAAGRRRWQRRAARSLAPKHPERCSGYAHDGVIWSIVGKK